MKEVYEKYEINYEDRKDYLYAFVNGKEDSLNVSISFLTKVALKCSEMKHDKLLIVENFETNVNMHDMFTLGELVAKLTIKYRIKIAFIDEEDTQFERNQFGELISQNRGARFKIFNSIENAEAWLLEDV